MFLMEPQRAAELRAEASSQPLDGVAINDAVIMGTPLPADLTLSRLAIEYVLLKQSLSAADFALSTHRC